MTKEQLIELIQKRVPDGDLVNFRVLDFCISGANCFYDVCGVDDDTNVGLWNILLTESEGHPFESAIENAKRWQTDLESPINWK